MKIILCEKTPVSFFSAVYMSYYDVTDAQKITSDGGEISLFDTAVKAHEDRLKAEKVVAAIKKRGGTSFYGEIADAYLSGASGKEDIIFKFLRLFFKVGKSAREMYGTKENADFYALLKKVRHEVHRLRAFIRLRETTDGYYYGAFRSDNDIITKLAPLFSARFPNMDIVLHDYVRGKAAFCRKGKAVYTQAPKKVTVELSDGERLFTSLWKQYHKNVSIKERRNYRLQRSYLPKKYRGFMTEFDDIK